MDTLSLQPSPLSVDDSQRYCRQLLLPQVSLEQQRRVLNTRVLLVGAGGLGCPCAQYLMAAGFRRLTLVDPDEVDLSNLHRQVLHHENQAGRPKVESMAHSLRCLDAKADITTHQIPFTRDSFKEIMEHNEQCVYSVIIDCSDNPSCKYLVSDVALLYGIPCIIGAALMWEGQLMVFDSKNQKNKACYRCIHPKCPPQQGACNEAGVIGMCVGVIGQLQALECLKVVLDRENYTTGWMLLFDGLTLSFKKARMRGRQKDCLGCNGLSIEQYDYSSFVSGGQPIECALMREKMKLIPTQMEEPKEKSYEDMVWSEFMAKKQKGESLCLIDVRPANQFKIVHLDCAINMPLDEYLQGELPQEDVYLMCRRGVASQEAALRPHSHRVFNLVGGIEEYSRLYKHAMPFI